MNTTNSNTASISTTLDNAFGIENEAWYDTLKKTLHSKNITIEDWNAVVKKIASNSGSADALRDAILNVVTSILAAESDIAQNANDIADTYSRITDETDAKLSNQYSKITDETNSKLSEQYTAIERATGDKLSAQYSKITDETNSKLSEQYTAIERATGDKLSAQYSKITSETNTKLSEQYNTIDKETDNKLSAKYTRITFETDNKLSNQYTTITNETTSEIARKIAEIVANAPEDFDTLKELADWLTSHEGSAAEMNSAIKQNAKDIKELGSATKQNTDDIADISEKVNSLPDEITFEGLPDKPFGEVSGLLTLRWDDSKETIAIDDDTYVQLASASTYGITADDIRKDTFYFRYASFGGTVNKGGGLLYSKGFTTILESGSNIVVARDISDVKFNFYVINDVTDTSLGWTPPSKGIYLYENRTSDIRIWNVYGNYNKVYKLDNKFLDLPNNSDFQELESAIKQNAEIAQWLFFTNGSHGLNYTLNDDGTYNCYSIGTCNDTVIEIGSIFNGVPVTIVEEQAFFKSHITSVTIPGSVLYIGGYAFANCPSLASVTMCDGVKTIAYQAFCFNTSLTSITIPDSVTTIASGSFEGCSSLASIVIPDSVTEIGNSVFYGCTSLTDVYIGKGIRNIFGHTFGGCTSLTDVYYSGTEEEWNNISIISNGNDALLNATIHYNYGG